MRIYELLNELTFFGSTCTKDCSGHIAGYNWAKRKHPTAVTASPSRSFNNGVGIRIQHHAAGQNPISTGIRGDKGRYQKFQAAPKEPKAPRPPKAVK